jgi:hypothetical protein
MQAGRHGPWHHERARLITPVPGGVGTMTIEALLDKTVKGCFSPATGGARRRGGNVGRGSARK